MVTARVRGEVRAGALTNEDRNQQGGPLVDPPSLRGLPLRSRYVRLFAKTPFSLSQVQI